MIDIKSVKMEINKYLFNFEYLLINEKNLKINIDRTKSAQANDESPENSKTMHVYIECAIVHNRTSGVITWNLDLNAQRTYTMNTTLNIQSTNLVRIIPTVEVNILFNSTRLEKISRSAIVKAIEGHSFFAQKLYFCHKFFNFFLSFKLMT